MLKAGSLYYAIIICVLIGICCMSFLLISHYSKMHSLFLSTQTELLSTNNSVVNYYLNNHHQLDEYYKEVTIFNGDIKTKASIHSWGFYKILKVFSVFKNDTIKVNSYLGQVNKDTIALYLPDKGKPIFMVGKAKIYGDVFVPNKQLKRGYITTNSFNNKIFLYGNKFKSSKKLPILKNVFKVSNEQNVSVNLEELKKDKLYNSFNKKTIILNSKKYIISNKKLSGNIILISKDSLYIRKNNNLENIIIKAPKVVFEKGFSGVIQIHAIEKVVLENNVLLKYPSGIFIDNNNNNKAVKTEVLLKNNSKICGSIVVTGNSTSNSEKLITIEKKAQVFGNVYCYGSTQLLGEINGTLYTEQFYIKTAASSFENYVKDGVINRSKLPNLFLGVSFNTNNGESKYKIIKNL